MFQVRITVIDFSGTARPIIVQLDTTMKIYEKKLHTESMCLVSHLQVFTLVDYCSICICAIHALSAPDHVF